MHKVQPVFPSKLIACSLYPQSCGDTFPSLEKWCEHLLETIHDIRIISENLVFNSNEGVYKMDQSVVQDVIAKANTWLRNPTAPSLYHLQKSLENLSLNILVINLQHSQYYLDSTQCLASLISLLNDPDATEGLIQQVLLIIKSIIQKPGMKWVFRETALPLCPVITCLMCRFSGVSDQHGISFHCLQILEDFTDEMQISMMEDYMKNLLDFVITNMVSDDVNLARSCFHILCNLCCDNPTIQDAVRKMTNMKHLYRNLFNNVNHPNELICFYSLCILVNLAFNSDITQQVFTLKHTIQAFELSLKVIANPDTNQAKAEAINLLIQLLSSLQVQPRIYRHNSFPFALEKTIDLLLSQNDPQIASMALKLLSVVIKIPEASTKFLATIASTELEKTQELFLYLSQLIFTTDIANIVLMRGMEILIHLVKESLTQRNFNQLKMVIDQLPSIIGELKQDPNSLPPALLTKHLRKVKYILDLLVVMVSAETIISESSCQFLSEAVFEHVIHLCCEDYVPQLGTKDLQLEILLRLLCLMQHFGQTNENVKSLMASVLNEKSALNLIAYTLSSSSSKETISNALDVLHQCRTISPSSIKTCCEIAASHNSERSKASRLKEGSGDGAAVGSFSATDLHQHHFSTETNIWSLIKRFKDDVVVQDPLTSEMMELYEHKIASLLSEKDQIENLLQTANSSLLQVQCRNTQMEVESFKLRKLLKECERKYEHTNKQLKQKQEAERELHAAKQTISELNKALDEEKQRIKVVTKKLEDLDQEYNTLSEAKALLQHRNDMMKAKQENMSTEIAKLEEERCSLQQTLREKSTTITELELCLKETREKLHCKENEMQTLMNEFTSLKNKTKQVQEKNSGLKQKISELECECSDLKAASAEKDLQIKTLASELESQKHILQNIQMIMTRSFSEPGNKNFPG